MNTARWATLMSEFGFGPNTISYDDLIKAHAEPQRHYHTAAHINACLIHLDTYQALADNPHEVELALWFHDAVYKPFSGTNEEDSAKWARTFLKSNDAAPDLIKRIDHLIMITKIHKDPQTQDGRVMLDIDLSILGTPADIYDQFEKNVRKEYRRVPWFLFRKKRKEILQSFLDAEYVYNCPELRAKWESRARDNLARAISKL